MKVGSLIASSSGVVASWQKDRKASFLDCHEKCSTINFLGCSFFSSRRISECEAGMGEM